MFVLEFYVWKKMEEHCKEDNTPPGAQETLLAPESRGLLQLGSACVSLALTSAFLHLPLSASLSLSLSSLPSRNLPWAPQRARARKPGSLRSMAIPPRTLTPSPPPTRRTCWWTRTVTSSSAT